MLDRADCAGFGCHNSIRLEPKHFLNTLALTFISFSGRFGFAMQKHYLFFASDPLVYIVFVLQVTTANGSREATITVYLLFEPASWSTPGKSKRHAKKNDTKFL